MTDHNDQDRNKGAVEQDGPGQPTNTTMKDQLGHRGEPPLVKQSDTDFPEPGSNAEHTGEPEDREDVACSGTGV